MIRSISASVVALAAAACTTTALTAIGIAIAPPAPAAPNSETVPVGAGYLATPATVGTAKVSLRIPRITCSSTSPKRGVRLGIFATSTSTSSKEPRPTGLSLSVRESCAAGKSHYSIVYRNDSVPSTEQATPGHLVRLTIHGATSFEVDDMTDGSADSGGGYGSSGGGAPKIGRNVLIGALAVGSPPHGVHTVLRRATVNRTPLAGVAHHRQGRSAQVHVGALGKDGAFQVTLV